MLTIDWTALSADVWVRTIGSPIYRNEGFLTWRMARVLNDEGFVVYNVYKCSEDKAICVASGCETFDDADDVVNELEGDEGDLPLGWISFIIAIVVILTILFIKSVS